MATGCCARICAVRAGVPRRATTTSRQTWQMTSRPCWIGWASGRCALWPTTGGGPIAIIMMLRHPEKVSGFFGLNTIGPWVTPDLAFVRHLWRFWYQIPILLPVIGPLLIRDLNSRFARFLSRWVGAGFSPSDHDTELYADCMRQPGHAVAGSRWYRTFQNREMLRWLRGQYADADVDVPVRWLHGMDDPVITPTLLRDYPDRFSDFHLETIDGVGHWIVEQRPELVLDRLRTFLRET
jgi:pimeloyl-ACP methyl ester carboxylesterase